LGQKLQIREQTYKNNINMNIISSETPARGHIN
jgi:hypothetical protein